MYALLYGIVGQVSSITKTSNPSFQGIKPIAQVVQVGTINDELRNSLWNALDTAFWSTSGFVYGNHGGHGGIESFSRILRSNYFKKPVDSRPGYGRTNRGRMILDTIREYFFNCEWNAAR